MEISLKPKTKRSEREVREVDVSGSDSDSSLMSVESTVSAGRKRPLSDSGEVEVAPKVFAVKRGPGRPPTCGKYVGLAQAKKKLAEATRAAEQAEKEAVKEREVAELTAGITSGRTHRLSETSSAASDDVEAEGLTATELNNRVHFAINAIKRVAKASKGLKGTCQKALKEAAAAIEEAAEVMMKRTSTEEVKRLRAENSRLTNEMAELRHEQGKLRADIDRIRQEKREQAAPSKPAQKEDQSEQFCLLLKEVSSLSSRFSVIEGRVLRPPLATDRGAAGAAGPSFAEMAAKPSTSAPQGKRASAAQKSSSQPSQKAPEDATSKKKGKGKGKASAAQAAPATDAEQQSSEAPPSGDKWETAGEKKKDKKAKTKAKKAEKESANKAARQQARLRVPRSAAIVLTLLPEAIQQGFTYGTVLAKAKAEINLGELGIAGVRCKTTVTGARMLEVAGADSGPQADALAEKLRASLEPVGVKVSRPTKSAELRIVGLDDSVSTEELEAAVARVGECSPAQVKSSSISPGLTGLRTAVVSCPVGAAKKLAEGGRLMVGWVSAQVKILQPRSLRCYRCFVEGHVGAQCTSEVDRSNLCYRCGQPGHKAGTCEAEPHCVLCAAVDKPANHRVGTKTCAAPKQKGKGKPGVNPKRTQAQEGESMET